MKLLLAIFPMAIALAQPAFDVASVKPSPPPPGDLININLGAESHGEVTLTNTTFSECLRYAYDLVSEDQIAGPDWIRERRVRFDIIAKAPPATPHSQLLLMMQTLLAERFKLAIHREPRKIAHFELTVGKGGPKLQESSGDGPTTRKYYGNGHLWYVHIPIGRLAVLMSRVLKQPVIDHTGLTGFYDVDLEWTPDDAPSTSTASDSAAHPDLFGAVAKQLGLKLESSKNPLEVIVVDRAEQKPIEN
jgi:uncharacterized protein (TIGR03435 family)